MLAAAGPLGKVIVTDGNAVTPGPSYRLPGYSFGAGVNALIMLNRVAFFDLGAQRLSETAQRALLGWAAGCGLGQDEKLLAGVLRRREHALAALQRQRLHVLRLQAQPEWRLAIGLGNKANANEIGLSLHGTYGWPIIPGSALKGLAAAWAAASGADPRDVRRVLGGPRRDVSDLPPGDGAASNGAPSASSGAGAQRGPARRAMAGRGSVRFLDALPAGAPAAVHVDVLTPHVKPYYDWAGNGAAGRPVPPAEHHNPVPVHFLTVSGRYALDVYGSSPEDVELAAQWLTEAGRELGAGGKTAAGYGYLTVTPAPPVGGRA